MKKRCKIRKFRIDGYSKLPANLTYYKFISSTFICMNPSNFRYEYVFKFEKLQNNKSFKGEKEMIINKFLT